jgi:hypothetical protein
MMNVGMRSFYPIRVFRGVQPLVCTAMRRLATAIPLALAVVPAASAHAAQAVTDRSCYLQTGQTTAGKTTVSVSGNGYGANRPYDVLLDGAPLNGGAGTTDAGGAMTGAFNPPPLVQGQDERTFQVAVQSDDLSAVTAFTLTRFSAGFTPSQGDPAKLKVRFSVYGFALGDPNPSVYVHYVAPNGKLRNTVRLGHATGACGSIPQTAKRRLFPFKRVERGRWNLQFDTGKTYRRGTSKSPFLYYTVGVIIRGT